MYIFICYINFIPIQLSLNWFCYESEQRNMEIIFYFAYTIYSMYYVHYTYSANMYKYIINNNYSFM